MRRAATPAATRRSLGAHPVPKWYRDGKLGIIVHWGLYSVPAWAPRSASIRELLRTHYDELALVAPYAEWYENSIRFAESPAAQYHRKTYGTKSYAEFRSDFESAVTRWDPHRWVEQFAAAGARYVVLATKHHDGYCLWPSRVQNPHRPGWHSARDCVRELAAAVRARGLRFGVYYSGGVDWTFNPAPIRNPGELLASVPRGDYPAYAEAQVRELIAAVEPDLLWNDIAWPGSEAPMLRLFADYYDAVPDGVVNDRWLCETPLRRALRSAPLRALFNSAAKRILRLPGARYAPPRPPHFDARTPEYDVFGSIRREKWECVRGIDKSFGFNRNSREEDFLSYRELIECFVDIVSKNGNLLLNVGPDGENARIPSPQLERLRWLGAWLETNGEAIYGTRPWRRAEGRTRAGTRLRFTVRDDTLYALHLGRASGSSLTLRRVRAREGAELIILGHGPVRWIQEGSDLRLELDRPLDEAPVHAIRIPQ